MYGEGAFHLESQRVAAPPARFDADRLPFAGRVLRDADLKNPDSYGFQHTLLHRNQMAIGPYGNIANRTERDFGRTELTARERWNYRAEARGFEDDVGAAAVQTGKSRVGIGRNQSGRRQTQIDMADRAERFTASQLDADTTAWQILGQVGDDPLRCDGLERH